MTRCTSTGERLRSELPPATLAAALVRRTVSDVAHEHGFIPSVLTRYAMRVLTAEQWEARIKGAGNGIVKAALAAPRRRMQVASGDDSMCDSCAYLNECRASVMAGGKLKGGCEI